MKEEILTEVNYKTRKHLVAFSGGIDSTNLLLELITERKLKMIELVFFKLYCINAQKAIQEEKSIKAILKYIEVAYPDVCITLHTVTMTHEKTTINKNNESSIFPHYGGYIQPLMWIINSFLIVGDDKVNLYLGFNKNDDMFRLEESFNNLMKWMDDEIVTNNMKLVQPLLNTKKVDILYNVMSHNLFDKTHWCEYPNSDGSACNKCACCIETNSNIMQILNNPKEYYSLNVMSRVREYIRGLIGKSNDYISQYSGTCDKLVELEPIVLEDKQE